jgi:membrane-bound lytic murein transglycosylase D
MVFRSNKFWISAIAFLLLVNKSSAAEPLRLSDKSFPLQLQLDKCFPDRRPNLEIELSPEFEEALPSPVFPELAQTLKLEKINHPRVQFYLEYFSGPFRGHFQTWLDRTAIYQDYIQTQLREHNLPESLFYLAFIESGLNPYAMSRAGAGGIWQFMPYTGMRYGLRVDFWADERRDLEKSTKAALSYLTELYNRFGSWPLAVASYNAGEGKVSWAVEKYDTDDYWELIEYNRCLKPETRDYLPKMIAASIIAENPEQYGFQKPPRQQPLAYDKVEVVNPVDLNKVARYCNISVDELRRLNPALKRDISPPNSRYELHLPPGAREQFLASLDKFKPEQVLSYYQHRVKKGETLSQVCQKYGASITEVQKVNHLASASLIRAGQTLIIPVPLGTGPRAASRNKAENKRPESKPPASLAQPPAGKMTVKYKVAKGDTLWSISQAAQVELAELKSWNKISSNLVEGQELVLYLSPAQAEKFKNWAKKNKLATAETGIKKVYQVKPGDNITLIAAKHQVTPGQIMAWNNLNPESVLQPGENLVLILPENK